MVVALTAQKGGEGAASRQASVILTISVLRRPRLKTAVCQGTMRVIERAGIVKISARFSLGTRLALADSFHLHSRPQERFHTTARFTQEWWERLSFAEARGRLLGQRGSLMSSIAEASLRMIQMNIAAVVDPKLHRFKRPE